MKLYKLTNADGQTKDHTQWGPGVTHTAASPTADKELCSNAWIHAYEHPLIAVLLNPRHVNFSNPRLWEADGEIGKRHGQTKCGCRSLTTTKEIPCPKITTTQRVAFAILVVKELKPNIPKWHIWADNWLSGKNRIRPAADAAYAADAAADAAYADAAADAAYADAAYAAADAAYADAAYAAYADAAYAADVAAAYAADAAADAAYAAAYAADVAAYAADAAADAADAAADAAVVIDLITIAERVVKEF